MAGFSVAGDVDFAEAEEALIFIAAPASHVVKPGEDFGQECLLSAHFACRAGEQGNVGDVRVLFVGGGKSSSSSVDEFGDSDVVHQSRVWFRLITAARLAIWFARTCSSGRRYSGSYFTSWMSVSVDFNCRRSHSSHT